MIPPLSLACLVLAICWWIVWSRARDPMAFIAFGLMLALGLLVIAAHAYQRPRLPKVAEDRDECPETLRSVPDPR